MPSYNAAQNYKKRKQSSPFGLLKLFAPLTIGTVFRNNRILAKYEFQLMLKISFSSYLSDRENVFLFL